MQCLLGRGTYDDRYPLDPSQAERFSLSAYRKVFSTFPESAKRRMEDFWGQPQERGFSVRAAKPKTDKKLLGTLAGKLAALDRNGDPWQEALEVASQLHCPALVIDTESAAQPLGQSRKLAAALGARYVALENLAESEEWGIALQQVPAIYH
jgi:hypothetical protein